jgi:hypothetical protein
MNIKLNDFLRFMIKDVKSYVKMHVQKILLFFQSLIYNFGPKIIGDQLLYFTESLACLATLRIEGEV